jgi:thiamine biosynthesis protein ThiI
MKEAILVKSGEMALKGLNRFAFEDIVQKSIRRRLRFCGEFTLRIAQSTFFIEPAGAFDFEAALDALSRIFGVAALLRCAVFPKDMEVLEKEAPGYLKDGLSGAKSFRVEGKRSDKTFPLTSPALSARLGRPPSSGNFPSDSRSFGPGSYREG